MESRAETDDERLRVVTITSGGRRAILLTSDGVSIEAEHHPGPHPGPRGSGRVAIVVAHGFTGALERPAIRAAAANLARHGGVVTFSFRGHGRSGGRSTVGDREVLDLDTAVRWARELGYQRVATVGFSMGGSVVLRHAGGRAAGGPQPSGERYAVRRPEAGQAPPAPSAARDASGGVDAVVAVSSPARWYYRGTAPMRRLHWVVTRPAGRLVSRLGMRTRVHSRPWNPVPPSPVESVPYIAPTPLLIVHGDRDAYFPLDHPRSLAAAAGPGGAELWIERGFGHAENAADPALLDRIGQWLTARVAAV
ncbi:alpha/beta hydrolase [Streptomyces sp.]|uniref:alpha/beta hydrolase n=1 Tax=Streptomyces sp. TaxID=1931 RepID=UPI002F426801